jgi:hypothetical protein
VVPEIVGLLKVSVQQSCAFAPEKSTEIKPHPRSRSPV